MSLTLKYPLSRRSYIRTERLIAICAVAVTVFGFAQPQVLSLAGLDFEHPELTAANGIDRTPTGSILARRSSFDHGLAGTLKPLRSFRD